MDNSNTPLEVLLKIEKEYKLGEKIMIKASIKNMLNFKVAMLQWNTVADNSGNAAPFIIEHDINGVVRYDGKLLKRRSPRKSDYLILAPNESKEFDIEITRNYYLNKVGLYNITADFIVSDFVVGRDEERFNTLGKRKEFNAKFIKSKSYKFKLLGDSRLAIPSQGMMVRTKLKNNKSRKSSKTSVINTPKNPNFIGGTSQQKTKVKTAHNKAYSEMVSAISNLNPARSSNSDYKNWFGTFNTARHATVKKNFNASKNYIKNNALTYDLKMEDCDDEYAYTYYESDTIWLCTAFFSAPTSGQDSQFGTIIHELTHLTKDTDDTAYGTTACKALAKNKPAKAINNADNYEYFSELV